MTTRSCFHRMPGRAVWLGCVAALSLAGSALAQTTASSSGNAVPGGYSTWDISFSGGYRWFQFAQNGSIRPLDFTSAGTYAERLTEDFADYFGLEEGFGLGFNRERLLPFGAALPNQRVDAAGDNAELWLTGVVYFQRREAKIRPFVDLGAAAVWYTPSGTLRSTVVGGTFVPPAAPLQTKLEPALAYGAGLKFNVNRFIGFRVEMRNYWSLQPHLDLPNAPTGPGTLYIPARGSTSSIGVEAGVTLRLGYHAPPPPPVAAAPPPPPPPALTVSEITGATDVCPGDNLRLSVTASGGPPGGTPTYQWYVNNQQVSGATSSSFVVPTAGASPGNESIRVTAMSGEMTASSNTVSVRIKNLGPPTLQFSVSPTTIPYGATATLSANATASECSAPASISYTASQGSISGTTFNSNGVSFDLSNRLREQSQVVTLTATATDARGQTATQTANVTVTLTPEARRLDDIVFQQRSARVNNCGKRLLIEELTPLLQADPGSKVILIGHRDTNEPANLNLDQKRVLNAAAVLSAGRGICPSLDLSRILVDYAGTDQTDQTRPALCGTSTNVRERAGQAIRANDTRAQYRRVEIWFVPSGADMPPGTAGFQTAPAQQTRALGCPR